MGFSSPNQISSTLRLLFSTGFSGERFGSLARATYGSGSNVGVNLFFDFL